MSGPSRRIFVGDVQGCADELDDLLEALACDPARDALWFAGDLVNRGPFSLRALRRAVELGAGAVLGNHDLHLLAVAAGRRRESPSDTFGDVLAAPDRDALLAWLRERPLIHEWRDVVLVHAGLSPRWTDLAAVAGPLEARIAAGELPCGDPDLDFLLNVRHCDAAGARPAREDPPPPGYAPWDRYYLGLRTVVCGHWAARGALREGRLRALDSGCVWGGALTAWIAEEDRFVQVPARAVYRQPKARRA